LIAQESTTLTESEPFERALRLSSACWIAPSDAQGVGTKACMDYLATRDDWLRIALPLSNGLFMMTRNHD
jgi:hypothetical protein